MSALVHRLQRNLSDYGWSATVRKAVAHLFGFVYFRQVLRIYRIDLSTANIKEEDRDRKFTYKILTAQDLELIAQIENVAEWMRGDLAERIEAGHLCLVALDGEKVAAFNLINFGRGFLTLVKLEKKLRNNTAWSEHIAVRKEYRRLGLGSQLRYRVFEELQKRGIRRVYGGTLRSNLASLNLTRSVGFEVFADIQYSRILGAERWRSFRARS